MVIGDPEVLLADTTGRHARQEYDMTNYILQHTASTRHHARPAHHLQQYQVIMPYMAIPVRNQGVAYEYA